MFAVFDFQHILVLLITLVGAFCVNWNWKYFLSIGLALQFLTFHVVNLTNNTWNLQNSLPLHLCSVAVFINLASLNTTKNWIKELSFYWTLWPVAMALLLPDLSTGITSFRFWEFFWSHILLFWSSILVTRTLKPNLRAVHISFAILVAYSLFFALPFNLLFKTNYVYLIEAPLKNVFPVFPYFIPILILILYILYWIQFLILKQFKAKL